MPSLPRQHGFTLIEVMVALTLIAISMTTLLSVSGQTTANATHFKQLTLGQWIAENKAAEYQIRNQFPPVGRKEGNVNMADREWRWRVKVSNTENADIRRLDIDIIFEDGDFDEPVASVSAFIGKPL